MTNYIGKATGAKGFGRTYRLKFLDKRNNLVHEIYQDNRNNWNGLRIQFEVDQQTAAMCQGAHFNIFNLSEETRTLLSSASKVVFEAGYELNSGVLYTGNIVDSLDLRQPPDYIYQIICMDYQDQYPPISVDIPKGQTPLQIIETVATKVNGLGYNIANLKSLPTTPYNKRINITQMEYTQAIHKIALLLNISLWVTNGEIYALPNKLTGLPTNTSKIDINYKTGMVGSPTYNLANSGVTVTTTLNHRLIPANVVKIEAQNPQVQVAQAKFIGFSQAALSRGEWVIMTAQHKGDSRDGTWHSYIQSFSYEPLGRNLT